MEALPAAAVASDASNAFLVCYVPLLNHAASACKQEHAPLDKHACILVADRGC
jgi:hypothetical protein